MRNRAQFDRYLTIFALSLPAAAIVWFVFHAVYANLTETAKAVGYVDPLMQMGINLGYIAMVGGTLVFAFLAAWAAIHLVRLLLRGRGSS